MIVIVVSVAPRPQSLLGAILLKLKAEPGSCTQALNVGIIQLHGPLSHLQEAWAEFLFPASYSNNNSEKGSQKCG